MRTAITIFCLIISLANCSAGGGTKRGPEILGVRLGMSREDAHKRLGQIGRLEREERKQQEVWALTDDPSYSHLIVAYDKEYKALRFATAVAKEGGRPVRYEDVMDVKQAQRTQAGDSVTYTLAVPASDEQPGHQIKVIGGEQHLKYYSVERVD